GARGLRAAGERLRLQCSGTGERAGSAQALLPRERKDSPGGVTDQRAEFKDDCRTESTCKPTADCLCARCPGQETEEEAESERGCEEAPQHPHVSTTTRRQGRCRRIDLGGLPDARPRRLRGV